MVRWLLFGLVVAVLFDVALRAAEKQPGVVILCDEGGVYRSLSQTEGFLASGGPCVLHDRHGGHSSADSIVCYDNANAAP